MALTRARRRILIATLVVVGLIAGLWWFTRPKIDPRLIGTWSVDNVWPGDVWRYRFAGNGTGEEWYENNGELSPLGRTTFHWHSEGATIVTYQPGIARHLSGDALNWYFAFFGEPVGWEIDRLEVVSVDANALHVKKSTAGEYDDGMTLTRVAE